MDIIQGGVMNTTTLFGFKYLRPVLVFHFNLGKKQKESVQKKAQILMDIIYLLILNNMTTVKGIKYTTYTCTYIVLLLVCLCLCSEGGGRKFLDFSCPS